MKIKYSSLINVSVAVLILMGVKFAIRLPGELSYSKVEGVDAAIHWGTVTGTTAGMLFMFGVAYIQHRGRGRLASVVCVYAIFGMIVQSGLLLFGRTPEGFEYEIFHNLIFLSLIVLFVANWMIRKARKQLEQGAASDGH